jgi:hypothetical protein
VSYRRFGCPLFDTFHKCLKLLSLWHQSAYLGETTIFWWRMDLKSTFWMPVFFATLLWNHFVEPFLRYLNLNTV